MFSYEERIRAVKLYAKYGKRAAAVIRELGYPDRHVLAKCYQEYISEGIVSEKIARKPKYPEEQRTAAVEFYLSHGKNMNLTIHVLGYPGRTTLSQWLSEDSPGEKSNCKSRVVARVELRQYTYHKSSESKRPLKCVPERSLPKKSQTIIRSTGIPFTTVSGKCLEKGPPI